MPTATPDPRKAVILVADFLGPETADGRDSRGVTRFVLDTLRNELGDEDDTSVVALGEAIIAQEGSDAARAAGEREGATIVIWGWYEESGTDAILSTHFEILQTPRGMPELEAAGEGGMMQMASLADLDSFTLHTKLSGQLTYFTLVTMGMARYGVQDLDRAVALLSDALAAAEELGAAGEAVEAREEVFFYRGNGYFYKEEVDRAIADYDRAIELEPDYALAYNNRGVAYDDKGEVDRAIADYDRAIELKPDYAAAYNNRGVAYIHKGEVDRAIADFDRAIELEPDYALAYYNRGVAYLLKGEVDRAIADFDRAIELKPDYAEAYYNRGGAYKMQGNKGQARADFEKFLELSDDPALREMAEGLLREIGE
jgi:Flp pilus assembly protein TadD